MSIKGGCASGARVDGALPRGFVRFLGLTAFQAEGCGIAMGPLCGPGSKGSEGSKGSKGGGIALRAMSFIMPPSAVTSTSSVIIILTLVHPFATSWPSSPKGDARTLRDLLSASYGIVSILVISRCAASPYPTSWDFPLFRGQNKPLSPSLQSHVAHCPASIVPPL